MRGRGVLAVYAVFFLSGISGLIYQVVWVRIFGNVFGNNVYSASVVTAIFMCGLGAGSFWFGRWADRRYAHDSRVPLRAYAWCELGIAGLALVLALVLPRLEAFSAAVSVYEPGREGWFELSAGSYAIRYAVAVVLLTPITFLMGGTLTLLIRALVARELSLAGWRIGALYGLNTLGAAAGAFATDFALVPGLGVTGTETFAIALNALAGSGAWWLSRGPSASAAASEAPTPGGALDAASLRRLLGTGAALFLAGAAALGMEILWFRYLLSVIGAYRAVFSLLLTVILLGICGGSLLGGWMHRRWGRPVAFYVVAQTGFVLATLAELAWFDMDSVSASLRGFETAWHGATQPQQLLLQAWFNLRPIFAVVGLPALLMGFTYPLANAHVQRLEADVGRSAGALYLSNTLGNVTGSLLVGFVLLPALGMQASVALIALCATIGLVPLQWSSGGDEDRLPGIGLPVTVPAVALLACGVVAWSALPAYSLLKKPRLSVEQTGTTQVDVLSVSEGINETVVVVEVPGVERRLYTNGHSMSSTHLMSQRYMRLFSHLPLLQMDDPRRVVVICFGVGNTLHAASLHPSVERLEAVDLSRNVIRHARFFSETNGDILHDPRTAVFINDGRQHLRMQPPDSIDLITLEPPPINFAGVASLYSREFYELARSRLVPGGFMTQWLPAYQISGPATLAAIRAFVDVFPQTVLFSGYERELILMGIKGERLEIDPERVREKLAAAPALRADLERIEAGTLTELLGGFAAGPATLARATAGAAPVTDDRPLMEYSVGAHLYETRIPAEIFDVSDFQAWCPTCFDGEEPVAGLEDLPAYLGSLAACYRGESFRSFSIFDPFGQRRPRTRLPPVPGQAAALRHSRYLEHMLRKPCAFEREAGARHGAPG